jgi:hypothetical protein
MTRRFSFSPLRALNLRRALSAVMSGTWKSIIPYRATWQGKRRVPGKMAIDAEVRADYREAAREEGTKTARSGGQAGR